MAQDEVSQRSRPDDAPPWHDILQREVRGIQIGKLEHELDRVAQNGQLNDIQFELVSEMSKAGPLVGQLRAQTRYEEAIEKLEDVIAINHEVFEDKSTSLGLIPPLAALYYLVGDLDRAHELYVASLEHDQVAATMTPDEIRSATVNIEEIELILAMEPEQRTRADALLKVEREMTRLYQKGEYTTALELAEQVSVESAELLGRDSLKHLLSLNSACACKLNLGVKEDISNDLEFVSNALAEKLGTNAGNTMVALNNLAQFASETGDYKRALQIQQQIVDGIPDEDSRNAQTEHMVKLALAYHNVGDSSKAASIFADLLDALARNKEIGLLIQADEFVVASELVSFHIDRGELHHALSHGRTATEAASAVYGPDSMLFAIQVRVMADLFHVLGDQDRAIQLVDIALGIMEQRVGLEHSASLTALGSKARILRDLGRTDEAESILATLVESTERLYGADSSRAIAARMQVALHRIRSQDSAGAIPILKAAVAVREANADTPADELLDSVYHLGLAQLEVGDYEQAETNIRRAQDLCIQHFGETSHKLAVIYLGIARAAHGQGSSEVAREYIELALQNGEEHLDDLFPVLSERQQIAMLSDSRATLDWFLSFSADQALENEAEIDGVYSHVVAWKGAAATKSRLNSTIELNDIERGVLDELNRARREYAAYAFQPAPTIGFDRWQEELENARNRKEDLEARYFHQLDRRGLVPLTHRADVSSISASVPEGTVFVDFFEYFHSTKHGRRSSSQIDEATERGENRLLAFILRPNSSVSFVQLGSTTEIKAAVNEWREAIRQRNAERQQTANEFLWNQIWSPIRAEIGDSKRILYSPDGDIHRLNLSALFEPDSRTYLIRDYEISLLTSIDTLASHSSVPTQVDDRELLLLGDVNYFEPIEDPALKRNDLFPLWSFRDTEFPKLPGTIIELRQIQSRFANMFPNGDVTTLTGDNAHEAELRSRLEQKPDYVHLATHGFFAPRQSSSEIRTDQAPTLDDSHRGVSPWLMSGLVLASPDNETHQDQSFDGFMTAEEVNGLDLRGVELVVLSACETGLGEVADGEGVLGLQRAFHQAGARTVIASLWNIEDEAAQVLMDDYYLNLWEKRLGRAESLRQAQLTMMDSFNPTEQTIRGLGNKSVKLKKGEETESSPKELPPWYWAGFQLSGEWE